MTDFQQSKHEKAFLPFFLSCKIAVTTKNTSIWAQSNMAHVCYRLNTHTTSRRFTSDCKLNVNSILWLHSANWFSNVLFCFCYHLDTYTALNCACKHTAHQQANWWRSGTLKKHRRYKRSDLIKHTRAKRADLDVRALMQVILYMHTCSVWAKNKTNKKKNKTNKHKKKPWAFG